MPRPRKKTKAAEENAVNENHSNNSQDEVHLVQDDNVATDLAKAYLGSMIIDIRMLSRNVRNRTVDPSFVKKLSESFQLGARRYAQEDRLKATTSSVMFEELLKVQINDQLSLNDVKSQTLRKTSIPVCSPHSYHGKINTNNPIERNGHDKFEAGQCYP